MRSSRYMRESAPKMGIRGYIGLKRATVLSSLNLNSKY